ncbi:MAG: aldehyde dehydrogenase family protein [Candidatus Hadarchaeota archaeon]
MDIKGDIFDGIYEPGDDGIPEFKFFIKGEWKSSDSFYEISSPIDGRAIARVSKPTKEQLESSIETIDRKGKEKIREYPGEKRVESFLKAADLIEENFEDFLNVSILDAGKTKENAEGEVKATIKRLRRTTMEMRSFLGDFIPGDWSEETLESEGIIQREPFGVVLAISPFNYPLFISATKVTPAILSGNATILKPPSSDPLTALLFTRVLESSGIPPQSLATVTTKGRDMSPLIEEGRIRGITFTGSTEVGSKIIKQAGIKSFHMELGGNDPALVLSDADLETTAEKIVSGITSYSGQRCDGIRMVLPVESIYKPLKNELVDRLEDITPKNPLEDENAKMGPLIDKKSAKYVEEIHRDAVENGAKPLLEFKREENYVSPTLLEADKQDLEDIRGFGEEVFGPFSLLIKVETPKEGIKIANSTKFGLDASVFGQDETEIRKIAKDLEVGAVFVNEYPRHGIGYYPFGGMKCSGIGREGVGYSINQLTTTKTIVHNFKGTGVWDYT